MKEIKTRIKVVPYDGVFYSERYYPQVQKSFLGFKYWSNIASPSFILIIAKNTIDAYPRKKQGDTSAGVKYIDYP